MPFINSVLDGVIRNTYYTDEFLSEIPKCELHCHLDGSVRLQTLIDLAKSEDVKLPYYTVPKLKEHVFKDAYGNLLFMEVENFTYDGSSETFTVNNIINSMIYVAINGLVDINGDGYDIGPNPNQITFNYEPVVGSRVSICYLR